MGSQKILDCKVERLTNGPKHHLFGFHDLVAWNNGGDKILSLEVDTINRPPLPHEKFGVGYVKDGIFVKVGETEALNYPQGARQQWIGNSDFFCVNNRVGDEWGTDIYDTTSNLLVDSLPASTHMLSPNGKKSYGLDYARLFRLGGYGYSGIADVSANDAAPSDRGITVQDIQTKEVKLLVSVRQVAECDAKNAVNPLYHHFLTHLCLNPSGTRLAFLHRYFFADGGGMTRLMTIGVDGSDLRCLAQGFLSHFDWKDDAHIYIYGRANSNLDAMRSNALFTNPVVAFGFKIAKNIVKAILPKSKGVEFGKSFIMISDEPNPVITPFAQGLITADGHPMTCPTNRDICVNDTYPDENGDRTLMLYKFSTNQRHDLCTCRMIFDKPDMALQNEYFKGVDERILASISAESLSFTRSGLHCDFHPRWNADGTKIAFDSIHEGMRQIYCVDINELRF